MKLSSVLTATSSTPRWCSGWRTWVMTDKNLLQAWCHPYYNPPSHLLHVCSVHDLFCISTYNICKNDMLQHTLITHTTCMPHMNCNMIHSMRPTIRDGKCISTITSYMCLLTELFASTRHLCPSTHTRTHTHTHSYSYFYSCPSSYS